MSNHLAIATVTAALRMRLENTLSADFTDMSVTVNHARPVAATNGQPPDPSVNIFLFQVLPNGARSNEDLPTREGGGRLVARPSVALDLRYLLSFYGDERELVPQRVLGSVVRMLESRPVVTRELLDLVTNDENFSYLEQSDLAQAIETVKFTPEPLSLEEMSKLWSIFFETPYALSVAYRASVVMIEAAETGRRALPVAERHILVIPSTTRAPAISPPDIADLQMWLTSDFGLTYDRDGVSRWEDQSGNANHAVQNDVDRRPHLIADGLGQKPVLRFDGDDDYLAIENLRYTISGEIGEITVCALVRSRASDRSQIIVSFDRSEYWRLALRDGDDVEVGWDTADSTGAIDDLRTEDGFADGRWHLICAWFDADAIPDKRVFVDGAEVASSAGHGGNLLGRGNTRFGFIGTGSEAISFNGARGPDWHLQGDLAELLIFYHALSDEERAQLEQYFVNRYRQ